MSNFRLIQRRSPNFDQRINDCVIDMLVLHYTGMINADMALQRLCNSDAKVSAHYFIDEKGECFQLVEEANRAWHAGKSSWAGSSDINSRSIGIELVNAGHELDYKPFPEAQMNSLERLAKDIIIRHVIPAHRILGHSDIAPSRKRDPGELFDWRRLASIGIGLWSNKKYATSTDGETLGPGMSGKAVSQAQQKLSYFGYHIEKTGHYDPATQEVVTAFQRHYRPERVDGLFDSLCWDRLLDLLSQIE